MFFSLVSYLKHMEIRHVMDVYKEALKLVKPSEEEIEEVKSKTDGFIKKVNTGLKDAKAVLGGSGAKGTWLPGAHDADVFVQFDYKKFYAKDISFILERHLRKNFRGVERLHGSRDYFQIEQEGFIFEIVPILKINKSSDAGNITDVSMLHAKWVKKKIDAKPVLADQIRLMKLFCKANKVYGAESYINGFSGYVCEILIIYYGSFKKLVNSATKWTPKVVIDIEKHYKNKNDVLFNLNNSKLVSPLVVVDPVQEDRNAAAALSQEMFDDFINVCKKFHKNPTLKAFERKKVTLESLKKKAGKRKLVVIKVKSNEGKEDVVGCKLLKVFEFISKGLSEHEFKVADSGWDFDKDSKSIMWWILPNKKLRPTKVIAGPPKEMEDHVKDFKKKYSKIYFSKGNAMAKVKREYREPDKLVKDLIKEKYVKEKVQDVELD